jgi:DNA-binding NtrC family response regulator
LKDQEGMNAPTILVVDDEPLVRWCISETLHDSGYRVTEAGDAASALRALAAPRSPTDAVLLDLRLPDSDDLGVLSAMHALSPAMPIILMTAHGSDELFDEARERGAFASLHKPFEMDDLSPLVARALAACIP